MFLPLVNIKVNRLEKHKGIMTSPAVHAHLHGVRFKQSDNDKKTNDNIYVNKSLKTCNKHAFCHYLLNATSYI